MCDLCDSCTYRYVRIISTSLLAPVLWTGPTMLSTTFRYSTELFTFAFIGVLNECYMR